MYNSTVQYMNSWSDIVLTGLVMWTVIWSYSCADRCGQLSGHTVVQTGGSLGGQLGWWTDRHDCQQSSILMQLNNWSKKSDYLYFE